MEQMTFSEYWSQLTAVGKTRLASKSKVAYKYLSMLACNPEKNPSTETLARLNNADRRITLRMFHPEIYGGRK